MSQTINFGIDLGTTNSVIARCVEGRAELFRNPMSMKETLPSVVAYRKKRILVGDKAREYLERDPHNVVGSFKRKMGTAERFYIKSLDKEVSPVDLSAEVVKELKNFVHTGEKVEAAVITIPASFDTVQSNATRQAGHQAGLSHVTLLQEPIAASLAFVNKHDHDDELQDGRWLVYDLGGGTFDVALVNVDEGEMKVTDHEGDNFLGGTDFDALIVEKLVVPYMEKEGTFADLVNEMKSASGKYNRLFFQLVHKAEEAKIQLSSYPSADIEFEVEDDEGELHDIYMTIERAQFEALIAPFVEETAGMIQKILVRNELSEEDIQFVLMVGGSTYIPYVRQKIETDLGIRVNCDIDPTTAVGLGAAHYAATRTWKKSKIDLTKKTSAASASQKIQVKMAYQKTTQELEEYFVAQLTGNLDGVFYRIKRQDGGFDSGLEKAEPRIEEDLPLVENTFNYFTLYFYDTKGDM
ncbi:MAG: Hsp70 family protein, partial [Bacteroidota bacterium]